MSNNIPEIRFKGFTHAWEQRTLEYMLDKKEGIRRGPFGSSLKKDCFIQNSDYVVYEQQNAIYDTYETRYYISKEKFIELNKFILQENDVLMSGAGTIGRVSRVPKGIKQGVFNQALIRLRINADITDIEYFLQFFKSEYMQQKLTGANPGSAITNLVPMSEVKKWEVMIPSKPEQIAIGNFFRTLDDTITLHKRKLDGLKELKRGYLQQMFPRAGESVPRVSFSRFTSDWERTTIGKISDIVRGASPRPIQNPKWFDKNSDVGWLRISDVTEQDGRINHLEQKISQAGQSKTRVLRAPHLLLSIAATVGKPVINYLKTGVHDGFLIFLNPKFEQEFMFQWLEMFRPQWQQYGQPGSQVNLNSELVKAQEVCLPTNEEQTAIGNFFRNLDAQISVQQQKLSQLKQLKFAYMQKMLV